MKNNAVVISLHAINDNTLKIAKEYIAQKTTVLVLTFYNYSENLKESIQDSLAKKGLFVDEIYFRKRKDERSNAKYLSDILDAIMKKYNVVGVYINKDHAIDKAVEKVITGKKLKVYYA